MKILPSALLFAFLIHPMCSAQDHQTAEENFIYWSEDYRLVWTDFEKAPQRNIEFTAISVIGLESEFETTSEYYKARVRPYFEKDQSWVMDWIPLLLSHEQGHFDLAELHARKFRKRLKETIEKTGMTNELFEKMSLGAIEELNQAHKEYDEATDYSKKIREQQRWNEYIREELQELDEFANPEVIIQRQTF